MAIHLNRNRMEIHLVGDYNHKDTCYLLLLTGVTIKF